jgi:molecular chaperone DnaJ
MIRTHPCDACGGEGKIAATPCSECSGRGRQSQRKTLSVDVPAGIADGQRIRLSGRGHAGEHGGPSGDLYVLVRVAEDERFVREGDDLVTVVEVSAAAAALGTTVTVPTLEGEHEIDIEPGTQPGEVVTLSGKGMPSVRSGRRGRQRVVVTVLIPRNLTEQQRELLSEVHESLTEENLRHARDESLFAKVRRVLR